VKEAQTALANALEVNESHQRVNGKLQERLTELEEENKKMHDTLEKTINNMRKSGL
jgi:Skp family chaperone for outer membrane proteins